MMNEDKSSKKHKKRHKSSSSEIDQRVNEQSSPPKDVFFSGKKIKQLTGNHQLWLFAVPESLDITSLSRQELNIPDHLSPNSVVASVIIDGIGYEIFENGDAENIVNIVPEDSSSNHVTGRPFQRSFSIRKTVVVPGVNLDAIKNRENVVQIVESARRQSEEIARTAPVSGGSGPQYERNSKDDFATQPTKKSKKRKNDDIKSEGKAESNDIKERKKIKTSEKKKHNVKARDSEKKRNKSQ